MATTLSPSTTPQTEAPPLVSERIQNAADISVIVIYFAAVLAVGLWVCENHTSFRVGTGLGGQCLRVEEVCHDKLRW